MFPKVYPQAEMQLSQTIPKLELVCDYSEMHCADLS